MTQLNQNTTSLQEILDAVNNLPDAGSGGSSLETVTVSITAANNLTVTYLDDNGEYISVTITPGTSIITCIKNSLLLCKFHTTSSPVISGGNVLLTSGLYRVIALVDNVSIDDGGVSEPGGFL